MKCKKILSVLCSALIAIAVAVVPTDYASAAEVQSGDYSYEILNNSTVMITGYTGSAATLELPSEIDGKNVTQIGYSAFASCDSLQSVTIPAGITMIEKYAFGNCKSLQSIVTDSGNENYSSLDGVLFSKDKTELVQYPSGKEDTKYTIPNSVVTIGWYAFGWCSNLQRVTIPDSVTSIGDYAFYGCDTLQRIAIPGSTAEIGEQAFGNCESLRNVTIFDGVTTIKYLAFYDCNNLQSITIPESVTQIGFYAFNPDYLSVIYGFEGSDAEYYANRNNIKFEVTGVRALLGDVNIDGVVDVNDVTLIQKMITESITFTAEQTDLADVNYDGEISINDTTEVQKYLSGITDKL